MDFLARIKSAIPPKIERDVAVLAHNVRAAMAPKAESLGLLEYSKDGYLDCFKFDSCFVANNFYGVETALKEYSNRTARIRAGIEHGVYFGSTIESEATINPYPGIITFSQHRAFHLRKAFGRLILPIGPYIHYCAPYLEDDDLTKLHSELGRTLLVFPKHSIKNVILDADLSQTLKQINLLCLARDIQTVLVCLYFNDVATELPLLFESYGYKVVCCGHRSDPDFLRKQRSLIELADVTASNSVGTHIGYCHHLGKEHVLFEQTYMERDQRIGAINLGDSFKDTRVAEMQDVSHAFGSEGSADERDLVVARYWGTGQVRSRQELGIALNLFDAIYDRTRDVDSMVVAARQIADELSDPTVISLVDEMLSGCLL